MSCGTSEPSISDCPFDHFKRMIPNCLEYATQAKKQGRPIVGIMCEFTPRELIMAAGAVPVCLCGGSVKTIAAAEEFLPTNLCPLIKSTFGYHVSKSNPFLEMADLIVAETTCDGKKKMYELMAQTRPVYVLELPQKPDDPDALHHWTRELAKLRAELERRFNVTITDQAIRQAICTMNQERQLRRSLAELMKADHPPLTGRQLLDLKSSISAIPADFAQYNRALTMLRTAQSPCSTRNKTRVLLTGVPVPHGAERVVNLIEEHGGLIVAMENCTGLKPIVDDVATDGDPIEALAKKYLHLPCSCMTPNSRRQDLLRDLVRDYKPHCIIELIWQACLTYDVEAHQIHMLAENELKVPYLKIETDYSPSDSARIATRIEALFETVQQRTL